MTSKPFAPARIVGGSVLVERKPFYNGGVHHFRGVEIIAEASNEARLPMPRAPYRVPSPAPPPTSRRVEVCEAMLLLGKETASVDAFHEVVVQLASLDGSLAPRVLHVFGREGRAHAMVLEQLQGAKVLDLLEGLRERGERIPIPVALAIAQELVPLWQAAGSTTLWVGSNDVILSPTGRVRVRPWVPTEFQLLDDISGDVPSSLQVVCCMPPESIKDEQYGERSRVYALGMLLYEMLVGGFPELYTLETVPEIVQWAHEGLPPVQVLRSDLPLPVAAFVNRARAPDPGDRFESWSELTAALEAVRSSLAPTTAEQLAAWLRSLPAELRPELEPPIDLAALGDWRSLPHSGYEPVARPGSPSDGGVG